LGKRGGAESYAILNLQLVLDGRLDYLLELRDEFLNVCVGDRMVFLRREVGRRDDVGAEGGIGGWWGLGGLGRETLLEEEGGVEGAGDCAGRVMGEQERTGEASWGAGAKAGSREAAAEEEGARERTHDWGRWRMRERC
jgi:hypothetical protein